MTEAEFDIDRIASMSPNDAAALLWVKKDAGLSDMEEEKLEAWLSASEENRAAWQRAGILWQRADIRSDPALEGLRQEALALRPTRRRIWLWAPLAASAAAAVLLTLNLTHIVRTGDAPTVVAANAPAWSNGPGLPVSRTLADGTQVTLGPQSAVTIGYGQNRRGLRLLRGRVYLAVAHRPDLPFTLLAGDRTITDLGTVFDVEEAGNQVIVTLAQGSVSVSEPGKSANILHPGEQLTATAGGGAVVKPVDADEALGWRNGMLSFHDTPLAVAVSEIERFGGPHLIVDPAVAAMPVNGRFRAGNAPRFGRALAEIYPVRVRRGRDGSLSIGPR